MYGEAYMYVSCVEFDAVVKSADPSVPLAVIVIGARYRRSQLLPMDVEVSGDLVFVRGSSLVPHPSPTCHFVTSIASMGCSLGYFDTRPNMHINEHRRYILVKAIGWNKSDMIAPDSEEDEDDYERDEQEADM